MKRVDAILAFYTDSITIGIQETPTEKCSIPTDFTVMEFRPFLCLCIVRIFMLYAIVVRSTRALMDHGNERFSIGIEAKFIQTLNLRLPRFEGISSASSL